jgi:hypothetical protein
MLDFCKLLSGAGAGTDSAGRELLFSVVCWDGVKAETVPDTAREILEQPDKANPATSTIVYHTVNLDLCFMLTLRYIIVYKRQSVANMKHVMW